MSMQKNKGSGYEREVAKILSDTFGYHFNRNIAGSGAFIGGSNAYRKNILTEEQLQFCMGDVSVPKEMKKMVVECKFYKEFPFHHFLINKSIPLLDKWIEQQLDIINEDSFWFVTFKINRAGRFIAISKKLCDFFDPKKSNYAIYFYKGEEYIVTDFDEFILTYKEQIEQKCC